MFEQAKLREPAFARVGDVPVLEVGGDQLERAQVRVRVDDDLLWGRGGGDVSPWRPGFLCKVAGLELGQVGRRQSGGIALSQLCTCSVIGVAGGD